MYTNWNEVPMPDKIAWAEWALNNNKETQSEEERLAWVHERVAARTPVRDPFAEAVHLPLSTRSEAARMRSRRYQIQKRLKEYFPIYQLFTPEEAARKTGLELEVIQGYLNYESQLPSSLIGTGPNGTFKILTGFELGAERGA